MSELEPADNFNYDAADAIERRRLREMDEKFCERLAMAIERGQEECPSHASHRALKSAVASSRVAE